MAQLKKAAELPPAQLQSLADRSRTLTEQLSAARRQLAEEAGERAALQTALLEEQGRAARRDQQLRAEQQRACGDTPNPTLTLPSLSPDRLRVCSDLDLQLQARGGQADELGGQLQAEQERLRSEQQRHSEARLRCQDLLGQVDALTVRAETLQR